MTVQSTRASHRWGWRPRWSAFTAGLLAFAAWEGTQSRRAADAHWSVLATIGCALVVAAVAGQRLQRKSSADWARDGLGAVGVREIGVGATRRHEHVTSLLAGIGIWTVLILATAAWDLYSFFEEVRSLPTLSYLFGDVTNHDWGRALIFAGWLALGAYLAIGWRRPRRDEAVP